MTLRPFACAAATFLAAVALAGCSTPSLRVRTCVRGVPAGNEHAGVHLDTPGEPAGFSASVPRADAAVMVMPRFAHEGAGPPGASFPVSFADGSECEYELDLETTGDGSQRLKTVTVSAGAPGYGTVERVFELDPARRRHELDLLILLPKLD